MILTGAQRGWIRLAQGGQHFNACSTAHPTTQLGKDLKSVAQGAPEVRGNIDLTKREPVKMQDGSMATVRSISFNDGKHEVLIPTINEDGKVMSDDEAIEHYKKTGKHLGKFKTIAEANAYAERLSQQEGRRVGTEKDTVVVTLNGKIYRISRSDLQEALNAGAKLKK
jgi:hypothetical protein